MLLIEVTIGKQKIHNDDVSGLFSPWSEREVFSITPVMTGAGRGVNSLLLGVVLIGAAIVFAPAGATVLGIKGAGGGLLGGALGTFGASVVGTVGLSLAFGGIAQMLSPVPKPPREATRLESNSFSGIQQTVRQGVPVPIAYGRVFVGSAVVSAGLDVDQV